MPLLQYTTTGKKVEVAVKRIVSGAKFKPSGTVINPSSLQLYYKYRDLEEVLIGLSGGVQKQKGKL